MGGPLKSVELVIQIPFLENNFLYNSFDIAVITARLHDNVFDGNYWNKYTPDMISIKME